MRNTCVVEYRIGLALNWLGIGGGIRDDPLELAMEMCLPNLDVDIDSGNLDAPENHIPFAS